MMGLLYGSGDIIVRLYERINTLTQTTLNFGFDIKEAYLTNMLEENLSELDVIDNKIDLMGKMVRVERGHGFVSAIILYVLYK